MAYSKIGHMVEMLETLAAKMESDLPSAIAAAKKLAAPPRTTIGGTP